MAAGAALFEAVATSAGVSEERAAAGFGRPQAAPGETPSPGVPGFQVTTVTPEVFLVTHRRTGRQWEVETKIHRPSSGQGAVGVRAHGDGGEFTPIDLKDVPEGFRIPITRVLTGEVPDLRQALISAVEALEGEGESDAGPSKKKVERVRDLADLHILLGVPIPFVAQTSFFRILTDAPPPAARRLVVLREILGFTPAT